ncbi:MAG TPA: YncE family protein [Bacteroidia bacterium]|nr:YncE family protein [Bacteroidia bacterium]HNT80536.1 YncE family protein [Bacteroidia bacterium]
MNDKFEPEPNSGYPSNIETIVLNKCATSGCHNTQSKNAASGLDLSSYDKLFEGNRSGAVVIPFRPELSSFFLSCNTFSDLGDTLQEPKMPINASLLSKVEVNTIKQWILDGARNAKGQMKFEDNPSSGKYYVACQGCDLVYIYPKNSRIASRVVDVGINTSVTESPHSIRMSPDGKYWYSVLIGGTVFEKFDAATDQKVAQINLGAGGWSVVVISKDSKKGFITDFSQNGRVAYVDLETMTLKKMYQGLNLFSFPHGIAYHQTNEMLYVTGQIGNFFYKIDVSDPMNPDVSNPISLQPGMPVNFAPSLDPHEVYFNTDSTQYMVTCERSNEVRVFSVANDALLSVIPNLYNVKEISVSFEKNIAFAACVEDSISFPGVIGSVAVIDLSTHSLIKKIHTGYQPHGIYCDDKNEVVYVANINSAGPPPHHISYCSGKNGNVTLIDLNTLTLIPGYKSETSVYPYFIIATPH